jgi:hypothetical protein
MTVSINNRTYFGVSSLALTRIRDGVIYNFPTPDTFVISPNIQQKIQTGRNKQGQSTRLRSYKSGEFPDLLISYTVMRPELISFQVGNELVTGSVGVDIPLLQLIDSTTYPAAAVGFLGHGVVEDVVASASTTENNLSVPLTQVPFVAGTPLVGPLEFSVGEDMALIFSNDLLGKVVSLSVPCDVTANYWSDLILGDHTVTAALVDTEGQVTIFNAPLITPNLEGSQINTGAETTELRFFLNTPPGACRAFNMYETEFKVAC